MICWVKWHLPMNKWWMIFCMLLWHITKLVVESSEFNRKEGDNWTIASNWKSNEIFKSFFVLILRQNAKKIQLFIIDYTWVMLFSIVPVWRGGKQELGEQFVFISPIHEWREFWGNNFHRIYMRNEKWKIPIEAFRAKEISWSYRSTYFIYKI